MYRDPLHNLAISGTKCRRSNLTKLITYNQQTHLTMAGNPSLQDKIGSTNYYIK